MAAHGLTSAVKLASNESPFGPLPGVLDAVAAATGDSGRYPDHLAQTLRAALAARHGVDTEQVAVGCCSVGMLQQLLLSYAGPGHEVLFLAVVHRLPQFSLLAGATVVEAPLTAWATDVDARSRGHPRTAMVLLANPNNPTSTAVHRRADPPGGGAARSVLLVVDEAYREYVTDPDVPDALDHFGTGPTSSCSGPSRRRGPWPGCASATSSAIRPSPAVDATLTPFSVSTPAQAAALAALEQQEEVDRRAAVVVAERERVSELAGGLPPRQPGNFVWRRRPGERRAGRGHGASRRHPTLPSGIRVTMGWARTTTASWPLVDALAEVLTPRLPGRTTPPRGRPQSQGQRAPPTGAGR
jgi:histidinol-phosphate aminotransferase